MDRAASGGPRRSAGFTLLEIVVVIALIAATGLLAVGIFAGGRERLQLNGSAKEIASQLRFARARAIATGVPQRFAIDPRTHAWRGADGRTGAVPKALGVEFTGAREAQVREGEGAILFFGDGASTGGRLRLHHGRAGWNIDVAWLTGDVALRRAEGTP